MELKPIVFASVLAGPMKIRELYFKYWQALVRSMREIAPGMSATWYIIAESFPPAFWKKVKAEYPNVAKWKIDPEEYSKREKGFPTFYSFEAANPGLNASRIVYLDVDQLCDGDWTKLAYGCRGGLIHMCKEPVRNQYGAAIIVVNRVAGYDGLYRRLLDTKHDGGWGTDQNIWNQMPITSIQNDEECIEKIAWSDAKGKCEHPVMWNLWMKTNTTRVLPQVKAKWERLVGEPMPSFSGIKVPSGNINIAKRIMCE